MTKLIYSVQNYKHGDDSNILGFVCYELGNWFYGLVFPKKLLVA
jgi:hypothetical protein